MSEQTSHGPSPNENKAEESHRRESRRRLSGPRTALAALALTAVAAVGAFAATRGGGDSSEPGHREVPEASEPVLGSRLNGGAVDPNAEQNHELDPVRETAQTAAIEFAEDILEHPNRNDESHPEYAVHIPVEGGSYDMSAMMDQDIDGNYIPGSVTSVTITRAQNGEVPGSVIPTYSLNLVKGPAENGALEWTAWLTVQGSDGTVVDGTYTTGEDHAWFMADAGTLTQETLDPMLAQARNVVAMADQLQPIS